MKQQFLSWRNFLYHTGTLNADIAQAQSTSISKRESAHLYLFVHISFFYPFESCVHGFRNYFSCRTQRQSHLYELKEVLVGLPRVLADDRVGVADAVRDRSQKLREEEYQAFAL